MTDAENSTAEPIEAESPASNLPPVDSVDAGVVAAEPTIAPVLEDDGAVAQESAAPLADAEVDVPGTPEVETAAVHEQAERPAPVADGVLLASVDIARAALLDVTAESTIGDVVGHVAEDDHVLSLFFDSRLPGYPGWHWTVTMARVDDGEATILETELMPGENALLAPDWVPWSERLADYQASQEVAENEARALAEAAAELDDIDDEDEDEDEFSILHAGDVDGVDVDEIDESADDDVSEDANESEDDESDDDEGGSDDDDDFDSDDDDDDDDDEEGPERSY